MRLNENNRGALAFKTLIFLLIIGYGTFAGYKLLMTKFTKSDIAQQAEDLINKIKGPTVYSNEKAEKELKNILEDNGVYENDAINKIFAEKTEDGRYIEYEFFYRIRTDLLLFQTDWETVHVTAKSDISKRM